MSGVQHGPVLLVGGSGFIGERLSQVLLERGRSVRVFDLHESGQPGVEMAVGDVLDVSALTAAAAGASSIVNLAAVHRDDVRPLSRYEEVNVGGAHAVVAAAVAHDIRHITFTSSVAVYGLDKHDVDENSAPEPFNEYGRTKLLAEEVFRDWAATAGRSLTIVRPSVVFGEGNRGNVYTLARQIASGRFLMIGRGRNAKSMSYVGNIAEYLADTLDAAEGTTLVNYADKPDLTTAELVEAIRQSLGSHARRGLSVPFPVGLCAGYAFDLLAFVTRRTFPISSVRVRKFVADTSVNTDKLERAGYQPKYRLRDAVTRTVVAEFGAASRD